MRNPKRPRHPYYDWNRLEHSGLIEALRRERRNAGLTQKRLAEKTGISRAVIAQYESGVRPIHHQSWMLFVREIPGLGCVKVKAKTSKSLFYETVIQV